MLRLILALTNARKTGTEHAAEGNLGHGSSRWDYMVTDLSRPIKRIPEKFCCVTTRRRKLWVLTSLERGLKAELPMQSVCVFCNRYKGPNRAGLDPLTGKLTPLFNPRRHRWSLHFRYEGGTLVGRTAVGRATVEVLRITLPNLIALREVLMEDGGSTLPPRGS
jgi:hypothetical protein